MLEEARVRRRAGVDVVVALVETHGRVDTAALLAELETLPRKEIDYRGQQLSEMDIDALLARRPALALIDEFAHTNAPGSRHPKRWQDVMEVVGAGIDVITTLNIQHIESLNDAVAQITGVRVRETVPDEKPEITIGLVALNLAARSVSVDGTMVKLTRKEFDVLALLARNAGRLVGHRQFLQAIWGKTHLEDTHYLRIAIGHIREKIGDDAASPRFIITEPGVGYRLIDGNA
jgi:DNA-binding winged helix-turn-helix (wHTH) protein